MGRKRKQKNYIVEKGHYKGHTFTGRSPSEAALKLASRGVTEIHLRGTGTNKVHVYRGSRKKVKTPRAMRDKLGETCWKPNVRKIRTERKK